MKVESLARAQMMQTCSDDAMRYVIGGTATNEMKVESLPRARMMQGECDWSAETL